MLRNWKYVSYVQYIFLISRHCKAFNFANTNKYDDEVECAERERERDDDDELIWLKNICYKIIWLYKNMFINYHIQ